MRGSVCASRCCLGHSWAWLFCSAAGTRTLVIRVALRTGNPGRRAERGHPGLWTRRGPRKGHWKQNPKAVQTMNGGIAEVLASDPVSASLPRQLCCFAADPHPVGDSRGASFCLQTSPLGESRAPHSPAPAAVCCLCRVGRSWCAPAGDAPGPGLGPDASWRSSQLRAFAPSPRHAPSTQVSAPGPSVGGCRRRADLAMLIPFQQQPLAFLRVSLTCSPSFTACWQVMKDAW